MPGKLQLLTDEYTIQAGDIATSNFCGRGYSTVTGKWTTCIDSSIPEQSVRYIPEYELVSMECYIKHSTGAFAQGVRLWVATVADPAHTGQVILVADGFCTMRRLVTWKGRMPLAAGLIWRIAKGGCVAGDIVGITGVYRGV